MRGRRGMMSEREKGDDEREGEGDDEREGWR